MARRVLCLNAGSSSLKFALFEEAHGRLMQWFAGEAQRLGTEQAQTWYTCGENGERHEAHLRIADGASEHSAAAQWIAQTLERCGEKQPDCIGHRVVHGGADYASPVRLNDDVVNDLRKLIPFAPLHQPAALAVIEQMTRRYPLVAQVACFDTAIHRRLPELAQRLPLPRWLWEQGVRRYGFHGLSYEYLLSHHLELTRGRTIIAHLGNGASVTAFRDGQPRDTTMGFTPTGGLMMGTRCGDLDPGVLVYLMKHLHCDADEIDRVINKESGLLGVSELSSDMQTLEREADRNEKAQLAVEMVCRSVTSHVAALAGILGGIDHLVFTAGIGVHSSRVRHHVCRQLEFAGVELDQERNVQHERIITRHGSRCVAYVLRTDEQQMIARHTLAHCGT